VTNELTGPPPSDTIQSGPGICYSACSASALARVAGPLESGRRRCQTSGMCEVDHAARAAKGQIELLLEEYRALRSEIDQRIGARATLIGFVAAGAAFIVSSRSVLATWASVPVFLIIVVVVWGSSSSMLGRLGRRIRALEERINLMAKTAYGLSDTSSLLQWETSFVTGAGWTRKFFGWAGLYNP